MNCGTMLIIVVVCPRVKITRRCLPERADPTVYGQETTGTGWEAEARNCRLLAGGELGIGVGNLFEVRLEAADWGLCASLYRLRLHRR